RAGQLLDFEILLNGTCVVTTPSQNGRGPGKRRVDVWEAEWRRDHATLASPGSVYGDYLRRKLEPAAELLDAAVTARGEVQARRGDRPAPIRFVAANLIGTLRVESPAAFLDLLAVGVGRSRAFGCGLLLVSRPGTVLA